MMKLTLAQDEALVLFELLARYESDETFELVHPSEERVLWKLSAQLEKGLVEPLKPNYEELLEAARKAVVDRSGT